MYSQQSLSTLNRIKLSRLAEGREVFDLSMINPDIAPPRTLQDRFLQASLSPSSHRYGVSRGVRRLREGFVQRYQSRFAVELNAEREVCATLGTKDALLHALACLAQGGYAGEVLTGAPTYPAHVWAVQASNLALSFFTISDDWQLMLHDIRQKLSNPRIRIILLNFPSNPGGVTVPPLFMEELRAIAARAGVFVLNDFVYGEMSFDGVPAASLLSTGNLKGVAEIQSLSKSFSVPGWRIGALAGDPWLVSEVAARKSKLDYGVFLPLQMAASEALMSSEDLVTPIVAEYRRRCLLMSAGLQGLGFDVAAPRAGASVWARLPAQFCSSGAGKAGAAEVFCQGLAERAGVICMPGTAFGADFADYIRFAMVQPPERLRQVLDKLEEYLQGGDQCSRLVA